MSGSNDLRRHELECLRLASDCMQLAGESPNPALQAHFVRMARVWQFLAERGPSADIQTTNSIQRAYPTRIRPSRRQPSVRLH